MNPSTLVERAQLLQAINADPELKGSALKVAVALMGFVNSKSGECFPSFEAIIVCCHLSKSTVALATQSLENRGWVRIERDEGGDRDSNRYYFRFDRIRDNAAGAGRVETPEGAIHGPKIGPCSEVHGPKFTPSMVRSSEVHGPKFKPELEEDNSIKRTQESLFGEDGLPGPFDFEAWFEREWWPQYPAGRRVEKIAAKKMAKAIIEGRRSDGLKATPVELLAGVMRYAAAMTGKDPQYIKHPTTWLSRGCWTDEHAGVAGRRASASTEAVWRAGEEMVARNRRAAG
jgi:hypothetical protein